MFVSGCGQSEAARERLARGGGPRRGGRRGRARRARRRRGCPALCIVPPPSRRTCARAARSCAASPASSAPNGRAETLVQAQRDGVDRRGERGERHAERDRGVRRAARRRGGRGRRACAPRRASASVARDVGDRAAGARVRVLEAEQRRARAAERALDVAGIEPAALGVDRERREAGQLRDAGDSLVITCAERSTTTDWPGRPCASSAARFAIVHVGTKTAASFPSSSAPRRSSSLTFSSSPALAQPSSASRIASHISSVGGAQKSRAQVDHVSPREMPPGPRARVLAGLDDRHAVHEHLVDALDVGERVLERRAVGEAVEVEHDEVGRHARPQLAAIGEAEVLRGHRRHLADRLLERQRPDLADVVREVVHVAGEADRMAGDRFERRRRARPCSRRRRG